MDALRGLLVRLRALVRRGAAERELDEEIQFHLLMEIERLLARGVLPAEARRRALVAFGGVERTKEAHRDVRGARWLEDAIADVRYALRTLRRSPGLALAAILTLALGIGANTAIFSAVHAVILRPLPFADPSRLYMMWEENPEKGWHQQTAAPANLLDWEEQVPAFAGVAGYTDGGDVSLSGDGRPPQMIHAARAMGNFFDVLGVRAARGRVLRADETWKQDAMVAVVSDRLWRTRFAADPDIVGRTVDVSGHPMQIVGVLPASFAYPSVDADLWAPTAFDPADRAQAWFRRAHWLRVVARLAPGVTAEQANAQLQTVVRRLAREYPETNALMGAGMTPLHEFLVGATRLPLLVLLGAVALLLVIACANVGNLLLVQATARERETALRLALGAAPPRLVRQALTESLVLAALGSAAGIALGVGGTGALRALEPAGLLVVGAYGLEWPVVAYVIAITVASGVLFGIAPALWAARRAPADALRHSGRAVSDGRRVRRWSERLVVGEVALAATLALGAGLVVRSFRALQRVDPGFDPRGVLVATVDLPDGYYDTDEKALAFAEELVRRARALPGAIDAAAVTQLPLTGDFNSWSSDFAVRGRAPSAYGTEVWHRAVTPGYFATMRVPLRRGRTFSDADRAGATRVIILNDEVARRYFKGQDPIGQQLTFDKVPDSTSKWRTVIGVVGSERQNELAEGSRIEIFQPLAQNASSSFSLVVRTRGDPETLAPALRRTFAAMDARIPLRTLEPMTAVIGASLARQRFLMVLLAVFAGVGLALAIIGVYGVIAFSTRRRTREIGIRLALGAQGHQVRALVVRQGLRLVATGLVLGTAAALGATQAMRALLFRVAPGDPLTFVLVPLALALAGLVAAWMPARVASRADPATTLRAE